MACAIAPFLAVAVIIPALLRVPDRSPPFKNIPLALTPAPVEAIALMVPPFELASTPVRPPPISTPVAVANVVPVPFPFA